MPDALLMRCLGCFEIAAARTTKERNLKERVAETMTCKRTGSSASPKIWLFLTLVHIYLRSHISGQSSHGHKCRLKGYDTNGKIHMLVEGSNPVKGTRQFPEQVNSPFHSELHFQI